MNENLKTMENNEVLTITSSIYLNFIYDLIDNLSDEAKQKVNNLIDERINCIKHNALESSCPDMNRLKLKYDIFKSLKKEL